jgi:hypothetical protein
MWLFGARRVELVRTQFSEHALDDFDEAVLVRGHCPVLDTDPSHSSPRQTEAGRGISEFLTPEARELVWRDHRAAMRVSTVRDHGKGHCAVRGQLANNGRPAAERLVIWMGSQYQCASLRRSIRHVASGAYDRSSGETANLLDDRHVFTF